MTSRADCRWEYRWASCKRLEVFTERQCSQKRRHCASRSQTNSCPSLQPAGLSDDSGRADLQHHVSSSLHEARSHLYPRPSWLRVCGSLADTSLKTAFWVGCRTVGDTWPHDLIKLCDNTQNTGHRGPQTPGPHQGSLLVAGAVHLRELSSSQLQNKDDTPVSGASGDDETQRLTPGTWLVGAQAAFATSPEPLTVRGLVCCFCEFSTSVRPVRHLLNGNALLSLFPLYETAPAT